MQNLYRLLGDFLPDELVAAGEACAVAGLTADSREVGRGFLFFAIPGVHADGHRFVPQVLAAGAAAVVHERDLPPEVAADAAARGAILVKVDQSRLVLSRAAANWHGRPADALTLVGVTGTDGKSSTVYFIHQLLEAAGLSSGFFSTVAMQTDREVLPNGLRQSTPEALELHGVLAELRDHGKTHAVVESTSHGLSHRTQRLRDLRFQGAVFTNLSHEHLEFHGSYEQYRSDKANLFRELKPALFPNAVEPFGVVNRGDPNADYFAGQCPYRVFAYASALSGAGPEGCTLYADRIEALPDAVRFRLSYDPAAMAKPGAGLPGKAGSLDVALPLPGTFNAENAMAALLAAACATGRSPLELAVHLGRLRGVKGRMVPVNAGQPFAVVVDYAHTPGAYAKVLPMFRASCRGRLIAVFGSAGERDVEKRPMQGELAARHCDVLVLTNEDPRLEDENAIIGQIRAGALSVDPAKEIHCVPDRAQAFAAAFRLAKAGDTVVLLGKGHEQCIIHADGKHPWDEEGAALAALADLGFRA